MDWQPIETAPKDGTDFYCCAHYAPGFTDYGIGYWYPNETAPNAKTSIGDDFDPTHWMPLPEPPK